MGNGQTKSTADDGTAGEEAPQEQQRSRESGFPSSHPEAEVASANSRVEKRAAPAAVRPPRTVAAASTGLLTPPNRVYDAAMQKATNVAMKRASNPAADHSRRPQVTFSSRRPFFVDSEAL